MQKCIRCHKNMEETPFCPWCGAAQAPRKRNVKTRGNGTGTAYKRGPTWTARVVSGWKIHDGKKTAVYRTKGGFKTKKEALAFCPELLLGQPQRQSSISFDELYHLWANEYSERITRSTFLCYQAAHKHFKSIHHYKVAQIRASDLQTCMNACPSGKRTKENMKTLASLLYKYAIQNDIVDKNRAESLYTGSQKKLSREPFTFKELELLKAAMAHEPYAAYVVCMCYLGFRPGEMLALAKSAYDPRTNCLIGGSKTKAGIDRPVPVSPKIATILSERLAADSDWLFPRLKDGKRMSDNYFRKFCFDPLMERMGFQNRVPYSCRHTFSNLLKNVRGSDTDKAALMGHADASTTKSYQEADFESLQKIINDI